MGQVLANPNIHRIDLDILLFLIAYWATTFAKFSEVVVS
jgi:hypothetical protein